jgi:hypothetical protein
MRNAMLCFLMVFPCAGCTNIQLKRSMISQASTLSDMQYQQVLNNLAMFAGNRSAIPWQITINDGSAQVADLGSAGFMGGYGRSMGNYVVSAPSLVGSRTIVEQWGTTPVTDDTELHLLQIAYRRAFGSLETLDDDGFANGLAHELKKQVSVPDDIKDLTRMFYEDADMKEAIKTLSDELKGTKFQRSEYEIMDSLVIATNDVELVLKKEQVSSDDFQTWRSLTLPVSELLDLNPSQTKALTEDQKTVLKELRNYRRCTPVVEEVRRLLKDTEEDLEGITPLWFGVGRSRKEVPPNACYIGHHADRCGEWYVWVCPDRRDELSKFTLTIIGLSGLVKDPQIVATPGGPRYAPASAFVR